MLGGRNPENAENVCKTHDMFLVHKCGRADVHAFLNAGLCAFLGPVNTRNRTGTFIQTNSVRFEASAINFNKLTPHQK